MTLLGCITKKHDLMLVVLAALVCFAGSWATIRLFRRTVATIGSQKLAWLVLTSVISGTTIWCTHFIAMLGFRPGVPVGFDSVLTFISLLITIAGSVLGFAIAASPARRPLPIVGGAMVGLTIAAMHYTGMLAYRVPGIILWDVRYLVASIVLSVLFSALALHVAVRRVAPSGGYIAAAILMLAIVCLHFTGMTAFRIELMQVDSNFSNPEALRALALAVVGTAIPVIGAGVASYLIDDSVRAEASKALSNMSNGLVMLAGDGTVRLYNDRIIEMFHLRPGDMRIGMPIAEYVRIVGVRHDWEEALIQRISNHIRAWLDERSSERIERRFQSGTVLGISCQPMSGGGMILTYDDVTEVRKGQNRIEHMAFHDALTGLPNRRSFSEHVAARTRAGSFAMLMLDLDHFKAVNDTLGHAIGDKLLVEVAQRLRNNCGPSDLLFRLGGDELALLATSTVEEAEKLAAEMVAAVLRPFQIGGQTIMIGLSVGVAMAGKGDDPELLQRMADLALYKAKESGRGRVEVYRAGMMEASAQRRQLEQELAMVVQTGQLELHYQPLYVLPQRKLAGFEALLRWRHPVRGLVSPDDFIPVAEQCGAILAIGAWVINETCRQAALWPSDIYVSINVSPVQLRSTDILGEITVALARNGLSPERIEVEVTETAIAESRGQIARVLASLRELGVRIAMDDFGTGFSSLVHLHEFELDRIKIDRSFISASHTDPKAAAVVRAITTMAREMGIATTGEGVESETQLANLVDSGYGTARGFLLGRPLDAKAASALVTVGCVLDRTTAV